MVELSLAFGVTAREFLIAKGGFISDTRGNEGPQEAGIPGTSAIAVVVPPPAVLISTPVRRDLDRDPQRAQHVGTVAITAEPRLRPVT